MSEVCEQITDFESNVCVCVKTWANKHTMPKDLLQNQARQIKDRQVAYTPFARRSFYLTRIISHLIAYVQL